jgi:hypothetical protein
MKNLLLYRIITYILLVIAAFMGLVLFSAILQALANPVALLPLFLLACIVIYTYCSWRFLRKGIDKKMVCKSSLRDLIRVNGYITIALASLSLFQIIILLTQPGLVNETMEQAIASQPGNSETTAEMVRKWTPFMLRFMLAYSSLLVVHTILSFRLLKIYNGVFGDPAN